MKPQTKYGVAASVATTAACEDVRNFSTRRRNLLYLMQRYLMDNGFYSSAETLRSEGKLSDDYELCDNVDLDGIYLEYASFFNLKFGKYPRIVKKTGPKVKLEVGTNITNKPKSDNHNVQRNITQNDNGGGGNSMIATWHVGVGAATANLPSHQEITNHQRNTTITTTNATTATNAAAAPLNIKKLETVVSGKELLTEIEHGPSQTSHEDTLFASMEWQSLAELVRTTILQEDNLKLTWNDICGNQRAIELLKEAVITPIDYPQLFVNGLKPWRSLLLHGPPGSGKTLLAKVLFSETQGRVTFFNITASIMVSKWRGESEKILRVLFHMAAKRSPSIVFFDEIESLTSKRDRATDHESSKRFKNELLQLLDGMEHSLRGVFVLASTNLPWDIDEAFLRRFEKKLLVQLPNATERANLIGRMLAISGGGGGNSGISSQLLEKLVQMSDNFTGDEIRLACKEISMQRVRQVTTTATTMRTTATQYDHVRIKGGAAAAAGGGGAHEANAEKAFQQIKPIGRKLLTRHEQWQQNNGN